MNNEHPLLPPQLNALCQSIAAGSGISIDVSALLILQALGAACGDLIQIRTPDRIDLSPSFHLALISNGVSYARGALTKLLGPLIVDSEVAKEQRDEKGIKAFKVQWEINLRSRCELIQGIQKAEGELAAMRAPGNPVAILRLRKWQEELIAKGREDVAEIDDFIDRVGYYLCPDFIVNEPRWRNFNSLPAECFDRNTLALCFANGPHEIQQLTASDRQHCVEALKHAQHGKPGVTVITCADEGAYADALSQRAVRKSEILNQFLFVEIATSGVVDPTPVEDRAVLESFHALLMKQFDQRVVGSKQTRRICLPDERGRKAHLDICKWVFTEQKNCAPQIAPFLAVLPDIALQLALGRAAMDGIPGGYFINGEFVERGVEFLKALGRRQRILLERLIMLQTDDEAQEAIIEKVVRRLEVRGPLTKRGLARTLHNQDYRRIEPILDAAIDLGRIEKRGEFYHHRNVSVSASATS